MSAAGLPEGSRRSLIISDEAWYADSARLGREPGTIEQWTVGVDALASDGRYDNCLGEGTIVWMNLPTLGESWQLQVFGDGIGILTDAGLIELLRAHPDADRATLRGALLAAGWHDRTARTMP